MDGALPAGLAEQRRDEPLALYLHIPWCAVRCGYCDFNTYVLPEHGQALAAYQTALLAEIELAATVLGPRPVTSVYFGGGTPTLMPVVGFATLIDRIRQFFALAPTAEISTEANPESLSPASLAGLRQAGVNRLSLGMQSAVPAVLQVLDRRHTPGRAVEAVAWARQAGFDQVSLDLMYGTPGESAADWLTTLDQACACQPDHLSAYSLIVEPGTRLAARIERGELAAPDEDDLADKYLMADDRLGQAGLTWYELSNWARPESACQHNLAYWRSGDWWGLGAGAHSHAAGVRWWNWRRPAAYQEPLLRGLSPAQGREVVTAEQHRLERVLLELRLSSGLDVGLLTDSERARIAGIVAAGQATVTTAADGSQRLQLTRTGRLLADAVVRDLTD
ncbi:MAG: radical SAM family heme chaperone HemW [Propionibacteriaceae bacterium]|nr:radical SAM family heme chaperone HemW [Propionibacteriaceae bacterium]